ncbi:MAG: proline--tRNA ligase [Anaerolineales bacterium]|nr:proline--tRNA ligase [Anaerolineales bacterium]
MRMSQLFSSTLRESPSEVEIPSHGLLLRAGFIRHLAAGIFTYLPLAHRSLNKIENIMRQEIDAIGGQEITMPVVQPATLWQESERWYQIGPEMGRFKDRNGRDMVLGMTHEEVVADLVRREIRSYRQLPALVYHIQTKWRDDPRPRAGLIHAREFTMLDSYSLDSDLDGLDRQYRLHYHTYFNIFNRCNLPVIAIKSDVGMMGGQMAHEFIYFTPIGEDMIISCDSCGYAANQQIARFSKPIPPAESLHDLEKVSTPDAKTIETLANFLQIPKSKTAKAIFCIATIPSGKDIIERFVFVVVRGDMEANEYKLANAIQATQLRPANDAEIRASGAEPGYASPVGSRDALVVVDDLIPHSPNLVAGSNENGYHLLNVNYDRDYQADVIADIVTAEQGYPCPECTQPLKSARGVEVGNIFKLGDRYNQSLNCFYLDKDGSKKPVIMGSYGISSSRLRACIAEAHHDEKGLIWPITVAPYQVHLLVLPSKDSPQPQTLADDLYQQLFENDIEVLYDDRDERPGVKFNDADLIGIPIRLTISQRSIQSGGVEFKLRPMPEKNIIPSGDIVEKVFNEISALQVLIE